MRFLGKITNFILMFATVWTLTMPCASLSYADSQGGDPNGENVVVTFNYANGTKTIEIPKDTSIPTELLPSDEELYKASDVKCNYRFDYWDSDVTKVISADKVFNAVYASEDIVYSFNVYRSFDGVRDNEWSEYYEGIYDELVGNRIAYVSEVEWGIQKYTLTGYSDNNQIVMKSDTFFKYVIKDANADVELLYKENPKFTVTYCKVDMVPMEAGSNELIPVKTDKVIGTSVPVYKGEALTPPVYDPSEDEKSYENAKYKYSFVGWVNEDGTPFLDDTVSENKTVYASFEEVLNACTVTFMDYDDDPDVKNRNYYVVSKVTVPYGGEANIPKVSTRKSNKKFTYTDHYWMDDAVNPVCGDKVVYAEHEAVTNTYSVIFEDYDGLLVNKLDCEYMEVIKKAPKVKRDSDDDYAYSFVGWANEKKHIVEFPLTVKKEMKLTAMYEKTRKVIPTEEPTPVTSEEQWCPTADESIEAPGSESPANPSIQPLPTPINEELKEPIKEETVEPSSTTGPTAPPQDDTKINEEKEKVNDSANEDTKPSDEQNEVIGGDSSDIQKSDENNEPESKPDVTPSKEPDETYVPKPSDITPADLNDYVNPTIAPSVPNEGEEVVIEDESVPLTPSENKEKSGKGFETGIIAAAIVLFIVLAVFIRKALKKG